MAVFVIFIFQVNTLAYVETCRVKYNILCKALILILQEAKEQGVGGTACRGFAHMGLWHKTLGTLPGLRLERHVSFCLGASGGSLGGAARGRDGSFVPDSVRGHPFLWKKAWVVKDMGASPHGKNKFANKFLLSKRQLAGRTAWGLRPILPFPGWRCWNELRSLPSISAEFHF